MSLNRFLSASEVQHFDQSDMSSSFSNVILNKVTFRKQKGKKRRLSTVNEDIDNQTSPLSLLNQKSVSTPEEKETVVNSADITNNNNNTNIKDHVFKRHKKRLYPSTESENKYVNESFNEEQQFCETDSQPLSPERKKTKRNKRIHNAGQESVIDDMRGTVMSSNHCEEENEPETQTFERNCKESHKKSKKHKKNHDCGDTVASSNHCEEENEPETQTFERNCKESHKKSKKHKKNHGYGDTVASSNHCEEENEPETQTFERNCKESHKKSKKQKKNHDCGDTVASSNHCEEENEPETQTFEINSKDSHAKTKKHKKNHDCGDNLIELNIVNMPRILEDKVGSTLEKNISNNVQNNQLKKLKHKRKKYNQNENEELLDNKTCLKSENLLQDYKEYEELENAISLKSSIEKSMRKKLSGNDVENFKDLCKVQSSEPNNVSKSISSPLSFSQLESYVSSYKDSYHNANLLDISCSPKDLETKSKDADRNRGNKPPSPGCSDSTQITLQENEVQNYQGVKSSENVVVEKPKKKLKRSLMLTLNESPDSPQKYNKKEPHSKEEDISIHIKKLNPSKTNNFYEDKTKLDNHIFISEKLSTEEKSNKNKKIKNSKDRKMKNNHIPKLDCIEQIQQNSLANVLRINGSYTVQSNISLVSDNCKLEETTHKVKSGKEKNKTANKDQNKCPITTFNNNTNDLNPIVNKNSTAQNSPFDLNKIKLGLLAAAFKSINKPQKIKKGHSSTKSNNKISHSKPQESINEKTTENMSKSICIARTKSRSKLDCNFLDPLSNKEGFEDTTCKSTRKQNIDKTYGKICSSNKTTKHKSKSIKDSSLDIEKVQQELLALALKKFNARHVKNHETQTASEESKNVIETNKSKEQLIDPFVDKTAKLLSKEIAIKNENFTKKLSKTNVGPNNAVKRKKSTEEILDPFKCMSTKLLPEGLQTNNHLAKQCVKTDEGSSNVTKMKKSKVKTKDPFVDLAAKMLSDELCKRNYTFANQINKTNEKSDQATKRKKVRVKTTGPSFEDLTTHFLPDKMSRSDYPAKRLSKKNEEANSVVKKKKRKVKKLDPFEELASKMLSEELKRVNH